MKDNNERLEAKMKIVTQKLQKEEVKFAPDRSIPQRKNATKTIKKKETKPLSTSMALNHTDRGRDELDKTQTDLDDGDKS